MWIKPLVAIILFYFSAILQNGFFAHFVLFGASLNLIFVFFFVFVFFEKQRDYSRPLFYAIIAGLFLDIFSYASLGISIVLLIIIAFLIKKTQSLLKEEKDNFSLVRFMLLFSASFILYSLLLQARVFIFEIIYNLFFAVLAFYACKKYVKTGNEKL